MSSAGAPSIYPVITPVPAGAVRPFWSIMIPVYNCAGYLRETLRSVLAQLPPGRSAQIEVIDDCSTRDDPEATVAQFGDARVQFFRQPANVGAQANFTTCIQRARGEWVHILHGDDLVAPGFYDTLETALRTHPEAVAAFCRVSTIDAAGARIDLSELEAERPGLHPDLIGRLGICNVILFPSMVVKRETYERLGGFHPALFHAADWDMWKRVALAGPVWYEPAPLAMYRLHALSDTSALMRNGANIADARTAIDVAYGYLPVALRNDLSRKARRYHALYALELAEEMLTRRSWRSAAAQTREAFRCSWALPVVQRAARLAPRFLGALATSGSRATTRARDSVEPDL